MPMQRRIPKSGFKSLASLRRDEVYLSDLDKLSADVIDLACLIENGLVRSDVKEVKIIGSGEVKRAITVRGLLVTSGAKATIEAAKGKVE